MRCHLTRYVFIRYHNSLHSSCITRSNSIRCILKYQTAFRFRFIRESLSGYKKDIWMWFSCEKLMFLMFCWSAEFESYDSPCLTSGSVEPQTLWPNRSKSSLWCWVFMSTISCPELVAKAKGTLLACKCLISFSAPDVKVKCFGVSNCFREFSASKWQTTKVFEYWNMAFNIEVFDQTL